MMNQITNKTEILKNQNDLKNIHLYNIYTMNEKITQTEKYAEDNNIKLSKTIKNKSFILNNNYVIAQMIKNTGECQYYYHNEKEVILKFITDNPNKSLFEVSTNLYPKVYFDIDKIEMDKESIKNMVLELMDKFNTDFNKVITFDNVIILGKLNENNKYKSIHIIFKNVSMCKKILKWWVNKRNENGKVKIDNLVYKSIQNFCLKNNTKYNDEDKPTFQDIFKEHNTEDYLINSGTDNPITEHQNYIEEMKKETIRKKELQVLTRKDKNIIKVNRFNIVDTILKTFPPNHDFYNSQYWGGLILTLKANDVKNIEVLLEESVSRAKNSRDYSITKNKEWYENNETEYKNIYTQLINFNTKFNQKFYWCGNGFYDTDELRDWVSRLSGVNIDIINIKFDKVNEKCYDKPTKITIDKDVYLDIKNMVYIDNNRKFTACYWNEYYKNLSEDNTSNFIKLTREEIMVKSREFINNDNKICAVKMVWGMGKSYYVMKPVIKDILEINENVKILMITENNALNRDVYLDYNEKYESKVWSHLNKSQELNDDYNIYICSVESITIKLKNHMDFDFIIFDEYETIISHLESETLPNPYETINNIADKMVNAEKIYLLDADLSNERINPLLKRLNTDKIELYESKENKWRDHKFNIFNNKKNDVLYKVCNDIENGKNLSIACMSKREAKIIFNLISHKYNNINILGVWSEEKYYKVNGEEKRLLTKQEAELSMNDMIDTYKINVWIYSPSIITGISYNKENWFNSTYIFTNHKSTNARLSIQMLFRVRFLKDKEINISLNELKPPTDKPTDEEIVKLINGKVELSKTPILLNIKYDVDKDDNIVYEDIYHQYYMTNYKEDYMSEYNLGQEILRILTSNHQIPLNFMLPSVKDANIELIKNDYGKEQELTKEEEYDIFMMTDFKNQEETENQERLNIIDNNDYISIREVNKKNALNLTGLTKSYYKKYGNKVECFDKVGMIYEIKRDYDYKDNNNNEYCYCNKYNIENDNNYNHILKPIEKRDIKITPFTHLELIHDNYQTAQHLTDKYLMEIMNNINNYNNFTDENINDNDEVNNDIETRNQHKQQKRVLQKVFPELFDNNENIIFKNIEFNHKELTERLLPHKEEIQNNWNIMVDINSHKKRCKRLNVDKLKDIDKLYFFIKHLLSDIGFRMGAPKNKFRDNEKYFITYENYIKTDYVNKERDDEELRIKNDKLNIDGNNYDVGKNKNIVSKSLTLKPKLFKEIGLKKKQKKLYLKNGVYYSPSIKNVVIKTRDFDKENFKYNIKQAVKEFYGFKLRPIEKIDNNLEEIYNKNRVIYGKEKSIEKEESLFNIGVCMISDEDLKALNKNCDEE